MTLAIRPERTCLDEQGNLTGEIENVVYVGTDTVYHLNIAGQSGFRVRQQNRNGALNAYSAGEKVRVLVPSEAIRVLVE